MKKVKTSYRSGKEKQLKLRLSSFTIKLGALTAINQIKPRFIMAPSPIDPDLYKSTQDLNRPLIVGQLPPGLLMLLLQFFLKNGEEEYMCHRRTNR